MPWKKTLSCPKCKTWKKMTQAWLHYFPNSIMLAPVTIHTLTTPPAFRSNRGNWSWWPRWCQSYPQEDDVAPHGWWCSSQQLYHPVLTCVSKWRVKMQTLVEAFESDPDETENTKQNLSLIIKLHALHVRWYIYIDLQDLFFDIKLMWKESESWFTKGQLKGPTDWCWADEVHRQDHWHQHSGDLQRFQEWVPSLLDVWIIYDQIVFQSNWNLTWIKSLDLALQPLHHSLTCPATSGIKMT